MNMPDRCVLGWVTVLGILNHLSPIIWIIARKEPEAILLHGLIASTMIVDVGLLSYVLHTIHCLSPSCCVGMNSFHLLTITGFIPNHDRQIYLPVHGLQGVRMLGTIIRDGGIEVRVVVF